MSEDKVKKELQEGLEKVSIIKLLEALIEEAYARRASDIHLVPVQDALRVRFRIDGVLHDVYSLPKKIQSEVITRIKVLASLRTDEHQMPHDGRFRVTLENAGVIDIRVSIAPTYYGENAMLRLLSDKAEEFTLDALGFTRANLDKIRRAISRPYGMILATGPTGSGKTTTLYTILKLLNTPEVSIITIEDPIEYAIEGIEQIQINPRTGLTFASGLRSILRQDPNIIMVGEIRDSETAGLAINTSLTGHLLLSTLHTNDAPTTLPRLLDMKIEPYLIVSTVNIAIGQRLVRKVCQNCKVAKKISKSESLSLKNVFPDKLSKDFSTFYHGRGCEACSHTGFQGRVGIQEVLLVDSDVREAILRKATAAELQEIAMRNGMATMIEDGLKKAQDGITTIEEVLRMLYE